MSMRTFDYLELDQRLLRLELPLLPETLRAVEGLQDAREAWEVLQARGLVSLPAVEPGGRVFRVRVTEPHGSSPRPVWTLGKADQPHPTSPRAAACVAAASERMAWVEALAHEVARALVPWGQPLPRRVVWHLVPPWKLKMSRLREPFWVCHAMHLAEIHASNPGTPMSRPFGSCAAQLSGRPGRNAAQRLFAYDVGKHEYWSWAVAQQATVLRGPFWWTLGNWRDGKFERVPQCIPEELVGRSFAELPDPFSPLLAIWDAGCLLGSMTGEELVLHLRPVSDALP